MLFKKSYQKIKQKFDFRLKCIYLYKMSKKAVAKVKPMWELTVNGVKTEKPIWEMSKEERDALDDGWRDEKKRSRLVVEHMNKIRDDVEYRKVWRKKSREQKKEQAKLTCEKYYATHKKR